MSCSCDLEPATIWRDVERRARCEHRCADCGGIIARGERYRSLAMLFDGEWSSAKRCADCQHLIHEVGRAFMQACGGWSCVYLGDLPWSWDEVCESLWNPDEVKQARIIVAMQHAACDARSGTRRWSLPLRMTTDQDDQ